MRKIKTGVRYLNVNYNWNEQKRTVACHLTWGINLDRIPFGDMIIYSNRFETLLNDFRLEEWENEDTGEVNVYAVSEVTGLAYCDPEDTFDLDLGKKIALTRAQECAFAGADYFWNYCEDIMLEAASRYGSISENCLESRYKCRMHIAKLTDSK